MTVCDGQLRRTVKIQHNSLDSMKSEWKLIFVKKDYLAIYFALEIPPCHTVNIPFSCPGNLQSSQAG